jgi:hypothetical protein
MAAMARHCADGSGAQQVMRPNQLAKFRFLGIICSKVRY